MSLCRLLASADSRSSVAKCGARPSGEELIPEGAGKVRVLGLWGLLCRVIEAVAHHHEPERVRSGCFDVLPALAGGVTLESAGAPNPAVHRRL